VIVFLAWAWWFPLDVASYAQGQVTPEGQMKRVQHLEGGIIREIRVAEGQKVEAGAVIAELEDVAVGSDVGDLRSRIASLDLKTRRINASLAKADGFVPPPALERAYPLVAAEAKSAFAAHRDRYKAMVQNHESRIAQRRAEIEEAVQRLNGLKSRSRFVAEQVEISAAMLRQKLTHEYEHLQLKKEQAQIDADRDSTTATLERARTSLTEATSALAAFRSDEEVNLRKELLEATTELNSLNERMKKPTDSRERTVVRAPVAGTVMTVFFKSKGGVVSPGGVIATLVPEGEALMVEARLPISEIGYVKIGSPARLSVAAGGSGFSSIDADVVHISPDAALDEKTGMGYYVVRLAPKELAFHRGADSYPLRPGVQVMAAILTGQRSVLALLLEPFMGSGIKPLTER
jgi:adhesin transport system membrane fusion protein